MPHSITPRVITDSPPTTSPPPPQRVGIHSLDTDCMHGNLSHLGRRGSMQLGPFVWRGTKNVSETSKIPSLQGCYTWPIRMHRHTFIRTRITQSLWSLHYGQGDFGFESWPGQEIFRLSRSCRQTSPPYSVDTGVHSLG